ncbi:MAG: hypothetical protein N4A59_16375 [Marinifilum sp.]|nr:hypothetical protein [Marinifilum sp.]
MKEISGYEAIARMRGLRHATNQYFSMWHLRMDGSGMREVLRCRVRPSFPKEKFKVNPELYLTYTDLGLAKEDQNKTCRRRFIRYVAFPPEFEKLKINWFTHG